MQEKLSALAAHLTEVEQQLADPAVYTDREKLTALRREQKELAEKTIQKILDGEAEV